MVVLRLPDSWSNWNLEILDFEEKGKLEYPRKTSWSKGENQQTNSNHIWCRHWDLNPGHIGGRQVLSPVQHDDSDKGKFKALKVGFSPFTCTFMSSVVIALPFLYNLLLSLAHPSMHFKITLHCWTFIKRPPIERTLSIKWPVMKIQKEWQKRMGT